MFQIPELTNENHKNFWNLINSLTTTTQIQGKYKYYTNTSMRQYVESFLSVYYASSRRPQAFGINV